MIWDYKLTGFIIEKKTNQKKKITKQLAVFEKPVCWFYINGSYFSDCLSCISFSTSKRVSVHSSVRPFIPNNHMSVLYTSLYTLLYTFSVFLFSSSFFIIFYDSVSTFFFEVKMLLPAFCFFMFETKLFCTSSH